VIEGRGPEEAPAAPTFAKTAGPAAQAPEAARLRLSDLCNLPGLLTLSRLPLACAAPLFMHEPRQALAFYLVAQSTDLLDGWLARRMGLASHTGAVLDGWLDKVLHVNLAWTLVNGGLMPGWWMLCWFSRELVQAPMVFWLTGRFVRGEVAPHHATFPGKLTAWLLGLSLGAVCLEWRWLAELLTPLCGLTGLWAALGYLRRELRTLRQLQR
jgi:phosphatidylglycerophosphate synthase